MNPAGCFARQVFSLSPAILERAYSSYRNNDQVRLDIVVKVLEAVALVSSKGLLNIISRIMLLRLITSSKQRIR